MGRGPIHTVGGLLMPYELQFLIMVNSGLTLEDLVRSLREQLPSARSTRFRSFDWSNNWVQVWRNDDHDESILSDGNEGFLYYPFRIEVSPIEKNTSLEHQVNTAK